MTLLMMVEEKFNWIKKQFAKGTVLWIYDAYGCNVLKNVYFSYGEIYLENELGILFITDRSIYGYNPSLDNPYPVWEEAEEVLYDSMYTMQ